MDRRKRRPNTYQQFKEVLRINGYKDYNDYLYSDAWKAFNKYYRQSKVTQHCLVCKSKPFVLHHISYKHICFERLIDVVPLCDKCHYRVHAFILKTRDEIKPGRFKYHLAGAFAWDMNRAQRVEGAHRSLCAKAELLRRRKHPEMKKPTVPQCRSCKRPFKHLMNGRCDRCNNLAFQEIRDQNSLLNRELMRLKQRLADANRQIKLLERGATDGT